MMMEDDCPERPSLPLVVPLTLTFAVVPAVALKHVIVALLMLVPVVMLQPEGGVQVRYPLGIVVPLLVTAVAVIVPPVPFTVVVDKLTVRVLLNVLATTSIGIAELFVPPHLTVTVAWPAPTGVTNPELGSIVRILPVVSEVVQDVELQLPVLLLTKVVLADICKVPPLEELRTAFWGLTAMLATEFSETKKPSQPTSMNAITVKPMNARTAVPIRDIAPPEHTFSS